LIAELFLFANKEKEAHEKLEEVARQFPHYTPALALQAVLAERAQKPDEVARLANIAALNNPKDAALFVRLGEDAARRYLFQESVAHFRRGLAIDSENWSAAAGLGNSLSRLGEEQEAKIHLEQVYKHDPFNVIAVNLLNLFDDLAKYDTIRTAHFLVRMHAEDRPVIGASAAELCEAAYHAMAPRYRVNFAKPIKIEIFPRHDDFAVRCFGLPGAEVFLGICFGPLLAMDSPRARERGAFNWQETLWHEIAHAVHLELTANRIPRWLAEGLAVYEAAARRSEWNMNMELAMIRALRSNALLPLRELDQGFTQRPETVSLVYYQASQIIAFIDERHGFDKVLALLPHFKKGRKTEEAVRLVFEQSLEDFDRSFRAFLRRRFQPDSVEVEWQAQNIPAAEQAETLRRKAEESPKNFFAALAYGNYLAKHGQPIVAEKYLQHAKKLLPAYVEAGNPYSTLADLYWKRNQRQEAARELEFLVSRNGKAIDEALKLGEWQLALQDTSAAIRAFARAVAIYPYQVESQRRLGELLLAQHRAQAAVQTFQAALALAPTDRAGIYCLLAEAYLKAGQRAQAKKQVLLALEIAPNYERAQEILLRTVE
jgi:tetratricopeptide (TPR) repeat protein